ncbi:MAG: hypothetical protein WC919_04470 [Candidatus Paceibacterota bacterium]|jgi:hypothetical protein
MYIEPVPIGGDYGESCTVFEIKIYDHLNHIDPSEFDLTDVPSLDPEIYYVTSGDAICKTMQLHKDLWILVGKIQKMVNKKPNKKLSTYLKALYSCAVKSKVLIDKLKVARGEAVFLETEWRDRRVIAVAKNPRPKIKPVE